MRIGRDNSLLWLITILVIAGIGLTALACNIWLNADVPQNEKTVVALYSDKGTWDESVQAAQKMFRWMNCTVELVDEDEINNNHLGSFRILCVPGGDMYQYAQDISFQGKENIREFIQSGWGYIGICGGAYFASERVIWRGSQLPMTPLQIFNGTATDPVNEIIPYPDYGMCEVNTVDSEHPITHSEPESPSMLYYWGPALIPSENTDTAVLGTYAKGNQPAMLAFNCGIGRVFLIGAHPEIEEDSQRDGVTFADQLDDPDSEWDLMRKAVLWILNE